MFGVDDAAAAGIIAAGASAISNAGTAVANAKLNKKNREWQEKMSALNYQRNIELWKMQNAYNTPFEQVKRLREAGLNPNLLYGNGSAATGNASDISPADVPSTPSSVPYDFSQASNGIASSLAMYQNWQLNNLNMNKVRNETENIAAETAYHNALTAGRNISNDIDRVTRDMAKKNAQIEYLAKQAGLNKTVSETWLNNSKKRATDLAFFQDAAAFETKLELLKANVMQAKASALNSFGNFQDAMARVASGLYGAQAANYRADTGLKNQQFDFLDPYYSKGFNPNWNPGQALVAAGFRISDDGPRGKIDSPIKGGIKSLRKAWNWYKSWNSYDGTPDTFFWK